MIGVMLPVRILKYYRNLFANRCDIVDRLFLLQVFYSIGSLKLERNIIILV